MEAEIQSFVKMKGGNWDTIKRGIETQREEEGGKQREKDM